jgi:hypothetical protein
MSLINDLDLDVRSYSCSMCGGYVGHVYADVDHVHGSVSMVTRSVGTVMGRVGMVYGYAGLCRDMPSCEPKEEN